MFDRPHHRRIAQLLSFLDADFLLGCGCYFGGGTAIVLMLDEYRESLDVDFLCSSQEGYRTLRNTITSASLGAMMRAPVELMREVRADRYGIRTFIKVEDVAIKFEVVSEGRIPINGVMDERLGVPVLSREDMYAEKLLANADHWGDKSALSRDAIDLALMISRWGQIPQAAWKKAHAAYGQSIGLAYGKAVAMVSDTAYLAACLQKMHMDPALAQSIPGWLSSSAPAGLDPLP